MASTFDRKSSSSDSLPNAGGAPSPYDSDAVSEDRPSARGKTAVPQKSSGRNRSFETRKLIAVLGLVIGGALVVLAFFLLVSLVFKIKQIVVTQTTRVSSDAVSTLAAIPSGSTLFGFDEKGVVERLESNPWIQSVNLVRQIPDTLVVEVNERQTAAIVMLSSGKEAWRVSSDGVWIEEVGLLEVTADNGFDAYDVQARKQALAEGAIYVYGVSATVEADAGLECTDEALLGVLTYINGFSSQLRDQITSFKATSKESIAITLENGVEISLGAATDVALKEEVVLGLLAQLPGQLSYINVRTPTSPTYRGLVEDDNLKLGEMEGAPTSEQLPYEAAGVGDTVTPATASTPTTSTATPRISQATAAGTEGEVVQEESSDSGYEGMPSDAFYNGGYELDDGTWVNVYYDSDGNLVWGYNDDNGEWVSLG